MIRPAAPTQSLKGLIEIKHGYAFSSAFFGSHGDYVLLTPGHFRETGGFRELGRSEKRYCGEVPSTFVLKEGDVLIAMTEQSPGLLGATIRVPVEDLYLHNQRLGLLSVNAPSRVFADYLYHVFNAPHVRKEISVGAAGTKVRHTSPSKLSSLSVFLPPVPEQRAITRTLDAWDVAIKTTEQLIEAKERRLAALSHQLLTSRRRLSGFENPWVDWRADEVFRNASRKGHDSEALLSVTQERGVIPRSMLASRVTMPTGNVTDFKLVEPGDFVISLRSFQGGLEHSAYRGLVSPAYTVLSKKRDIDERFFRHYFKSADFIKRLSVAVIGIRDGKQISFQDFCSIKLPVPTVDEQRAISSVLDEFEREICLLRHQADSLRKQKRGLMEKLLTGQWRLPLPEQEPA